MPTAVNKDAAAPKTIAALMAMIISECHDDWHFQPSLAGLVPSRNGLPQAVAAKQNQWSSPALFWHAP